jgi:hypothetical protein
MPAHTVVIPNNAVVIRNDTLVIPNEVRDLGFAGTSSISWFWVVQRFERCDQRPRRISALAPEVHQFFIFGLSQVSTIFVGSIASLSTCSSRIFPSFPIRKFTRRAALYLSR